MIFSKHHFQALAQAISAEKMNAYLLAAGGNRQMALNLYLWDRRLAVGFLADIALIEPALRNAMNTQLVRKWGPEWYADPAVLLDERTRQQLSAAWARASDQKTPGDVIARCMFGFWRGLLDRGDYVGRAPRRVRCNYDNLWRGVLDRAFPGGRAQAASDGLRWQRSYALAVVSRINELRNRVAHHESFVSENYPAGHDTIVTIHAAHHDCLRLAGMLDRDLLSLVLATSEIRTIISQRPLAPVFLVATQEHAGALQRPPEP